MKNNSNNMNKNNIINKSITRNSNNKNIKNKSITINNKSITINNKSITKNNKSITKSSNNIMNKNNKLIFDITDFNTKNLCYKNGGENKLPELTWNLSNINLQSYALIMEDPDAPINFIHWFIPYISSNNTKSYNIHDAIVGYNSLDEIGYHGPCNPEHNRPHRYIFTLYALDGKITNILKISSTKMYEDLLRQNDIKILAKKNIIYNYNINNGIHRIK